MSRACLILALFLSCPALAAPPSPTPTAAPAVPVSLSPASPTQGNDLSSVAGKIKLDRTGTAKGAFSATESTVASPPVSDSKALQDLSSTQAAAAKAAQERMNRAVKDGVWTDKNINYNTGMRASAANEWDAAAENCRRTPGCTPTYRFDGAHKALKSDEERLFDYSQKIGVSGAKRPDYAP